MKTKKKVFNLASITEYKTLEKYFERMASKGWLLTEAIKSRFVFTKTEPKKLDFNVSLFYPQTQFDFPDDELAKDYREICEDAGWTYCASNNIYQIFYKDKNQSAIEIHTDSQEEYKIVKSTFLKTEFASTIILLIMALFNLYSKSNYDYSILFANISIFNVLSPYFLILFALCTLIPATIWFIRNKIRVNKGYELTFVSYKAVAFRSILLFSIMFIFLATLIFSIVTLNSSIWLILMACIPSIIGIVLGIYCISRFKTKKRTREQNITFFVFILIASIALTTVTMAIIMPIVRSIDNDKDIKLAIDQPVLKLADFNTNDKDIRTSVTKNSSIFVPEYVYYYESIKRKAVENEISSIRTLYLRCVNLKTAKFIFKSYVDEEQKRLTRIATNRVSQDVNNKYYNVVKANESRWNVDDAYYLNGDKTEIILRKGVYIYVIDIDEDLSKPEYIDVCLEKLKLSTK